MAPSVSQQWLLRRLSSLMLADGPFKNFEVLQGGRRFHQLVARLSEISDGAVYPGHDVLLDNSTFPELKPCKFLNASWLKVVGEGSFGATAFLSPELCMTYRFPGVMPFEKAPSSPWKFPENGPHSWSCNSGQIVGCERTVAHPWPWPWSCPEVWTCKCI